MKDFYLTEELRLKYYNYFQVVLNCQNGPCKLDPGLDKILIDINSNKNLQSILSQKNSFTGAFGSHVSYIILTFTKDIESRLKNDIIPRLKVNLEEHKNKYKDEYPYEYELEYNFNPPDNNPFYEKEFKPCGIGYFDDEFYFWVNTVKITLESECHEIHEVFWNFLRIELPTLGV